MLEIMIQGRGGQGAQTAGNLLARTFFEIGREVQSFATYGGARRGTPVSSFIRVDDRPIRLRCDIERPDAILCFDASLLAGKLLGCATADTLIVVNSAGPLAPFEGSENYRLLPIDGLAVARANGLGRIVNSALLGGFARALGAPPIEALAATIEAAAPVKKGENARACRAGFALADQLLQADPVAAPRRCTS